MKKKVLFVDDEPNLLGGLRRSLRSMNEEMTPEFAEGGAMALALMEKSAFDVVVSDMRMPGMSGLQLLDEVRNRYPHMVRIILTGQCDGESALLALRVAHQMLSKPCDAASLKLTLARTFALSDFLANPSARAIVTSRGSIPSLPTLYRDVVREMDSPTGSAERVAAIISEDLGMTAKVLHVVNSSFFGLKREITDPRQAVSLLGMETIRTFVLAVGIFSDFQASPAMQRWYESLQVRSHKTSALVRTICQAEGMSIREIEVASLAGMLHDVGQLILVDARPNEYAMILKEAANSDIPLWRLERDVFGASHAEVGACLLGLWGLPIPVVEAVAWHHQPCECPVAKTFSALTAVHVASVLSSLEEIAEKCELDRTYLEKIGANERLPVWCKLMNRPTLAKQSSVA